MGGAEKAAPCDFKVRQRKSGVCFMKVIRTVSGDIMPEQLGWCQCHEHIFIADGPSRKTNEALYMDDYDKSLAEVLMF